MRLPGVVPRSFLSAILVVTSARIANAAAPAPQGVSPGAAANFALAAACPTFSWTSFAGAHGYELVVYPVEDETGKPSLEALLPSGASSWTPAADRCLTGGRYAWSVRVVTDRVGGEWAEALLFEVGVAPSDLAAALDVLRRHLGSDALARALEAARTASPEVPSAAGPATSPSAEDQASRPPTQKSSGPGEQGAGAPLIAVRGEVPDVAGETYGVRGVSNSPDGAGVRADNNASGADLVLGGSPVAELTESSLSRDSVSNLTFGFSNPGAGTMTLQVDSATVATNATVFPTVLANDGPGSTLDADLLDGLDSTAFLPSATDDWVNETGDTMTGLLTLDPAAGFALQTGTGDGINLGGNLFKGGTLFLHDSGDQNVAVGENALSATTSGEFNTAVGTSALIGDTAGSSNTAIGAQALVLNTTGSDNTAVGVLTLANSVAGQRNSALGAGALRSNTSGLENVAVGQRALYGNSTGSTNVAVGTRALDVNTTGASNTAVGADALGANTTSSLNTALGRNALLANTGSGNTAVGADALDANTVGGSNTALGVGALGANTTGNSNTAVGRSALLASTADNNTAVGAFALDADTSGQSNTAVGSNALGANVTGSNNTAVGREALVVNTSDANTALGARALDAVVGGSDNTAVGQDALGAATGSFNIAIGSSAGVFVTTGSNNINIGHLGGVESNTIRIGTDGTQTATFIAGIEGNTTGLAGVTVLVDANGELGTISSSRRYKEDIAGMGSASERILALRPVSFRYKQEVTGGEQPQEYGLIAEEVAEVFPELVVHDHGRPETVRYHVLTPLLLNELQRQQREIEALRQRLAQLEGAAPRLQGESQ